MTARLAMFLSAFLLWQAQPKAAPLVADLSSHLVAITTAFSGSEVVLFGAVDGPGDVVVVVTGPLREAVVRQKDRVAGVWMNTDSMVFADVPSFYWVASSRPIAELADAPLLERSAIGVENLKPFPPRNGLTPPAETLAPWREALARRMQAENLWIRESGRVDFIGGTLFRTTVTFPGNVPVGQYTVNVLLLRDREVVAAQTTPLYVNKIGVGAGVFTFAHRQAAAYGLIAIVLAVAAGWLAGAMFRRS